MSDTSAILIDTLTLNISDTYSCCLEITIGKQRKCSILVISPYISSDFTLIAKMIGVLEMLLLICIFSLCLLGSIMRFKARQNNKVIDAALKEIGDEDFEKFGGPYIVTPHAEAMRTHVTSENLKNIVLQDADPKIVDRMADGDFPPSYEELALRRMSKKITTVRYWEGVLKAGCKNEQMKLFKLLKSVLKRSWQMHLILLKFCLIIDFCYYLKVQTNTKYVYCYKLLMYLFYATIKISYDWIVIIKKASKSSHKNVFILRDKIFLVYQDIYRL